MNKPIERSTLGGGIVALLATMGTLGTATFTVPPDVAKYLLDAVFRADVPADVATWLAPMIGTGVSLVIAGLTMVAHHLIPDRVWSSAERTARRAQAKQEDKV